MTQRLLGLIFIGSISSLAANYGGLPVTFENYGQPGAFISRAAGFSLTVTRELAVFAIAGGPSIQMRIVGSESPFAAEVDDQLQSYANYLIGRDPAGWRTHVSQYGRVRVREVLPGTDIIYYGNSNRLEFDLLLKPGADAGKIRLRFAGDGIQLHINQAGDLTLKTRAGDLIQQRPNIQQEGKRVPGNFRIDENGDVGFELGPYDHTRSLSIDPVVSYLTYLGGTAGDSINAITVDSSGNAYIAGSTSSSNFPVTTGAIQTAFPPTTGTVAFVTKLNPTGTGLVYTTFLGGSGINSGDSANAIAVDASGNAYVAGTTGSANFPVIVGSLSTSLSGATDAFVAKINPTGTSLIYSTYLGGSGKEAACGIALDSSGDAFVTGSTGSTNFPVTTGVAQSALKSANDAFVAKLNPTGKSLVYSTYLGGSAEDDAYGIALDASGNAYVTGSTASTDFPATSGAFQKSIGPASVAFVTKLNAAGTALSYSTFLGGTGGDSGNAIAVDSSGAAYVAGTAFSADFPTTAGVFSSGAPGTAAYGHAFVTKVNATGAGLVYSTYLGGSSADGANGLALDASLNAIVAGFTNSLNFPVTALPADPVANYSPAAFLAKINPAATAITYSTLLGASGSTVAQSVAMDSTSHAYVAGYTESSTLPASAGAFQTYNATLSPQASTGFVAKLDLGSAVVCSLSFSPVAVTLPASGGATTASVVAPAGCAWEAIPGGSWLTVNPPSSSVGPGTVSVTAGSNAMSLNSRLATVNAGAATLTVTQSAGSCSAPQFYPATQTIAVAGGTGSVAVALPAGCTITATSTASWITINSGATGSGDDLVTFTVAANSGGARSGTITIAGAAYTVSQVGALCVTSLTPSGTSIAATGGSLTTSLVAAAGCGWTVASSGSWLTVSPVSGTGSATLTLTAVANVTGAARSTTLTAAGLSLTVTQVASMPSTVSVSPNAGSGISQVFTAVYSDTGGASTLTAELFLINSVLNGAGGCYTQVYSGNIYLVNDAGNGAVGPLSGSGTLSNSQCTLNGAGSSVASAGNNVTLTISITFNSSFAGLKNIYMYAIDPSGNSGFQTRGNYTVR